MNDEAAKEIAERMLKQSKIVEPGETMFVILHTGDDGIVPDPIDEHADDGPAFSGSGTGSAHGFGPFVTEGEAEAWQETADVMRPCTCRKALIEIAVPRLLGVIGPAMMPLDLDIEPEQHAKDRLN